MAREYTVALPGGGFVTVNASDPAAARENAGVGADAEVQAGGHQAYQNNGVATSYGGPEEYAEPQDNGGGTLYNVEGAGVPDIDGGGAAAPTKAKPKTGQTTPDPGMYFGMGQGTPGGDATNRTKAIYEGREGESLEQWMQRVFRQGTRDFGGPLSTEASNPYGRTPYANWFQNRYQDVLAPNIALEQLLGNTASVDKDTMAQGFEQGVKDFHQTGKGQGFGATGQSLGNLGMLNDLMNSYNSGNTEGLSPGQMLMLKSLNDSPGQQMAMLNAQFSGGAGANPFMSGALDNLGQRMLSDYYDDIVGKSPATNGTFLQNFLRQINASQ